MNGNKIVIDTNIVLFLLSEDKTLEFFLDDKELYISFITEMEILNYHGITEAEKKKIVSFLRTCTILDINEHIKHKAIQLRQQHRIKLPDSIIAATSWYIKAPLMTADKGFKSIKDVDLILYTP